MGQSLHPFVLFFVLLTASRSGLDTSKFDSSTLATFDNVNTLGFWEGSIDSVSLNGADLGLSGRTAILDTGTTLMVLPQADAEAILSGVDGAESDGQGGFVVPCDTTASLALTFGGQEFTIEPTDFAIQPVSGASANNLCTCGITSGNIGGATEWLVSVLSSLCYNTFVGDYMLTICDFARLAMFSSRTHTSLWTKLRILSASPSLFRRRRQVSVLCCSMHSLVQVKLCNLWEIGSICIIIS